MRRSKFSLFAVATLIATSTACVAAAAGGLGAGIYYSDRGAESLVAAPIDQVFAASRQGFQ